MNQSPLFENINLFDIDLPLQKIIQKNNTQSLKAELKDIGQLIGSHELINHGKLANKYEPIFHSHDSKGTRVDLIEFHPSYHSLMDAAIKNQMHAEPWSSQEKNAHTSRMAKYYLYSQNESGTCCPITMTFSSIPAIQKYMTNADLWVEGILSNEYDPRNIPFYDKKGLTIGMAMTEKQGGTDVRANETIAKPIGERGRGKLYQLTGHKWFCSAPMCDAFLTLAQTDNGLSCFLFPRWKEDGTKNDYRIQRLKTKLGNKSNASSEIEFEGAHAWLMGDEGRGVSTIIEMVSMTRYDCMIGSTAIMRRSVNEAIHHCHYRSVFGKKLIDQPLMQQVLSDLCLETNASLAMTAFTAHYLDNQDNEANQLLLRILRPVGKYYITKRASSVIVEAMECMGGNGYIEDSLFPRLYREAPVNAIWEGSGNVQCLDVFRAFSKMPELIDVLFTELEKVDNKHYIKIFEHLKNNIKTMLAYQTQARYLTETIATLLQVRSLDFFGMNDSVVQYCNARFRQQTNMFGNPLIEQPMQLIDNAYAFN